MNKFMDTDLDPNTPGDEGDMYDDLTQRDQDHLDHNIIEVGYSYNDFLFFDKRTEEEKCFRKGGSRKRVSQNQIYFFQKYQKRDGIQMMDPVVLMAWCTEQTYEIGRTLQRQPELSNQNKCYSC